MPSFSLVIEYLTGYAVATDPTNREQAEWPVPPAKVFMAMAAAHFETNGAGKDKADEDAERAALEWLAGLDPPTMTIPQHTEREVLTVFVPVNDQNGGDALLSRSRQPRTFPRVHVGNEPVQMTWQFASDDDARHLIALETVCRNVTRIGHPSSLIWCRLERDAPTEPTHVPDPSGLGAKYRTLFKTMLRSLEADFGQNDRDDFQAMSAVIERLEAEKKQIKGKGAKERKADFDAKLSEEKRKIKDRFGDKPPRGPLYPSFKHAVSYKPVVEPSASDQPLYFDPNFIVLKEHDDATQGFNLESTAQITKTLRKLIMDKSKIQPVPSWVGGHECNGDKLTSQNHMALIPLAFVGRHWIKAEQFADGHLMGLGIVLPRNLPYRDRANVLAPFLFKENNEPKPLELTLGKAGIWKLVRETDLSPKRTLQTLTYTAPSRSWASVTPVLLDRMPKADRVKEPCAWREEVAGIIVKSCEHVGLPEPIAVRVEKTPFFVGSLRAMPGQGGFPQLRKGRFQVHVAIEFDRPVQGPVLLGAGRFRGYGLMRPWTNGEGR